MRPPRQRGCAVAHSAFHQKRLCWCQQGSSKRRGDAFWHRDAVISARPGWLSYPVGFIVVWAAFPLLLLFGFGPYVVDAFVRGPVFRSVMTLLVSLQPYLDRYRWIEVRDEGLT